MTATLPTDARSLCEYLVRRLVDEPDAVAVTEEAGETGPVFAAVSPGNARSLRTVLALGFAPVGSEVLLQIP